MEAGIDDHDLHQLVARAKSGDRKLVPAAIAAGLVDPGRLALSRLPHREADRLHLDVERIRTAAEMYRSMPKYAAPNDFAAAIREALKDGHLR
jgi:hypothetical protein